jgi:predicted unusual protein kinase regulating ubiquinone biosynthesis (AarF/ABC1/UbiB family)
MDNGKVGGFSVRPDLIPEAYVKALVRLQDRVKPFPYAEVERIVESELGVRISKAFSRFDPDPIAGASLGQVHMAALRDGREVVVKVQRPGVPRQVAEDFEVLAEIAVVLDQHTEVGRRLRFGGWWRSCASRSRTSSTTSAEAQNLVALRQLSPSSAIRVPQPIAD